MTKKDYPAFYARQTDKRLIELLDGHETRIEEIEAEQFNRQVAKAEAERVARENTQVSVPRWALELICEQARQRFYNLNPANRVLRYADALDLAARAK